MKNTIYKAANRELWQGRVDSESNFNAFRWHQLIKFIDLSDQKLPQIEGKRGFAFIGFCCDEGIRRNKGRIGAAQGPDNIRKELATLPCWFDKNVDIFDVGNIYCENIDLEASQAELAKIVEKVLNLRLFPIILGGGHEVALGSYMGTLNHLRKENNKPRLGIINFDAHFDLRPYDRGGTSGTMFRQIADMCKTQEIEYSYLCVGVEKYSNTVDLFKTAEELGVKYIKSSEVSNRNYPTAINGLEEFLKTQDHIYMTVCSDVFSAAHAPGVSAPQSLGLDPKVVLEMIEYVLDTGKTISFDIAEVSPIYDRDNMTADLASMIIFSVVR